MTEQNEAIVRRLVDEVMNAGRLEILDEIYTPKMASAARAWIAPFRVSFPDVHLQVVDLVVEGDEVGWAVPLFEFRVFIRLLSADSASRSIRLNEFGE